METKKHLEKIKEAITGGILGACIGDALGVPVEFLSREEVRKNPVVGMLGYGTHNKPPGTWSDDSSMMLCLLDSLSEGLDYQDIMEKFVSWLTESEYTPHQQTFGVGAICLQSIQRYLINGIVPVKCGGTGEMDNGNGSLMRILPIAFYIYMQQHKSADGKKHFHTDDEVFQVVHDASSLTHAHKRSLIACGTYVSIALELIHSKSCEDSRSMADIMGEGLGHAKRYYGSKAEYSEEWKHFDRVFNDGFANLPQDDIKSSGYVLDTLEAALWCLMNTESYKDCVLKAVNLGGDTDTVASVAGGLAGIYYGCEAIPTGWVDQIPRLDYIVGLCEALEGSCL